MRTEVIKADSIDAAAERILDELKEDAATTARSISSRNNVIYFDGWDGLGASAVLRAVAQRLTAMASSNEAPAGLKFDQIIHVDCSKWESKRSLQRAVAEQLELPGPVMDMFDRQDEEDDFHGIPEGSRTEIPQVLRAMFQHIQERNRRFLVILHNGSTEEMHLTILGFLLFGYSTNKVLWTFQGRFRLYPMTKVQGAMKSSGNTDVLVSATSSHHGQDVDEFWSTIMREEAAEVVASLDKIGCISHPSQVIECFTYMCKLCYMGYHFRVDYDLATHCWNYMICDGIIIKQLQHGEEDIRSNFQDDGDNDGPWKTAQVLKQEMRFDVGYYRQDQQSLPPHLVIGTTGSMDSMPHWTSPIYGALLTSSVDPFQVFAKLGVLKLSRCNFSSSSTPPFLYYPNMKFLWIDHCRDIVDGALNDIRQCFKRLWVLDIRHTSCDQILSAEVVGLMTQLRELYVVGAQNWDIRRLQGRLPNIRKLRVAKSTVRCSGHSEQDLLQGMNKMELLDFSGNRNIQGITEFSEISTSNNYLETLMIIDGCVGIHKFSFRGCAKLKNMLLSGLFEDLCTLDLSGTAVKTLDLSAMTAQSLDELILDKCDKLCAILWPTEDKRKSYLNKLHIDTTQSASTSRRRSREEKMKGGSTAAIGSSSSSWPTVLVNSARAPSEFNWHISVKDTRLLRSIVPYFEDQRVHLEISSPSCCPNIEVGGTENEGIQNATGEESRVVSNSRQQSPKYNNNSASMYYADVDTVIVEDHLVQGGEGKGNDAPTIRRTWPCPPPYLRLNSSDCYLYTQDHQMKTKTVTEGGATATIPRPCLVRSRCVRYLIILQNIYRTEQGPSIICNRACILHVHDSLYNTSIPGSAQWDYLLWCRVEQCSWLEFIFTAPQLGGESRVRMCWCLRTFWASQLPRTRFMWDMSKLPLSQIHSRSFEDLTLLHLDFCPRLIHVLPFSSAVIDRRYLETIEIVWCGDLKVVFPLLDTNESHQEQQQQKPPGAIITMVDFPNLKRIHLHELPMLESICGLGRMYAPKLETIKIRGCWSLKHLPAIENNRSNNKVECDCEKDWWDKLEWDGLDGKHHPSLYRLVHSRYYKKKLLRGSVLI